METTKIIAVDKDENSKIQIIRTKNAKIDEINERFDGKQALKKFFCFFLKTLDKHQNLWYNRGTSSGTTKAKGAMKMENFPHTMLHFTTWDPEHGECNRESTYRIQSADDLADKMEQMKSAWIFEEFSDEEYHENAAAVRRAIAAGEHMRAWITQDTDEGEIELARSEIALADYMEAIADDISWWDEAPHAE